MNWLRRSIGSTAAISILLAACGLEQSHGYVQSNDGSLSFRHPAEWQDVDLQPVGLEWIAGIDGSATPDADNINAPLVESPFVVAQVYQLEADVRDSASLRSLRLLSLAERPDPAEVEDPALRLVFDDIVVDENGFEGHHLRLEIDSDDGTSVEEHFAVFDPDRSRVHRVWITCSLACFMANAEAIDDVFGSVSLRP
ncbi:MAG: hypothetical protein OEV40_19000 [Acidimicrobiia bacterium]|nr:hypothetical protein [Acidimicrobiia bacterium]